MLFKESWVYVTDNTNIRWIKLFHLYKGFSRKKSYPGLFVKASSRVVEPPRLEYKGFKYKYSIKGDIVRSWLVRSSYNIKNRDTSTIHFNINSGIIVHKKQNIKSKFLNGPFPIIIKRKKLYSMFKYVV